jgi:protein-S-isoprenylcysteine O-methyltransferase Ste14
MNDAEARDNPRLIAPPPLILLAAIVVAAGLEFLVPVSLLPVPGLGNWLSWIGALLCVAGVVSAITGLREFRHHGTNVNPTRPALKLVTSGPYRFTRNPMYLGMALLLAGIVLMFSLEWGILVWIVFVLVINYGVIVREERYLTGKFGAPYAEFLRRTRRWL